MSHTARIGRREMVAGASASAVLTALKPALAHPTFVRGGHVHVAGSGTAHTMTVANKSGAPLANYPLQFGCPFVKGAIQDYPQVLINGTPVQTQADVKNRHSDGSVKYSVLSLILASIPSTGALTLSFRNQVTSNNTPLSTAAMLDPAYDFDAGMSLAFTSGSTGTVSARQMLQAGDYKLWTSGPISQTIELADDTAARKYDLGNGDGFQPFRPRFYATFWPSLSLVQVRFAGSNGLTTEVEDLRYNLTLTLGSASPQTVYTIDLTGGTVNNKLHWALTNWTKIFWIGSAPDERVNIDYNLAFLSQTGYFPNYDTNLVIPEATLAQKAAFFATLGNDLYDATWNIKGNWQSGMASPGERAEIAPYPEWTIDWLYGGDYRARKIALTMADLASAFPANLRETDPTKRLSKNDGAGSGSGLGHAISVTDRKTVCLFRTDLFSWVNTLVADRVKVVGLFTQKWSFDGAHQPSAFYPQYILTGDPYYLNQMYMWAGFSGARYTQGQRGPTGAEGAVKDELRGYGWVLRNRAEAACAAPDSHPEKAWLTYLLDDALAELEGGFGISGTVYDTHPMQAYGVTKGDLLSANLGPFSGQPPTLRNWESNGNPLHPELNSHVTANENSGIYQQGTVGSYTSPWQQYYVIYALGRIKELGFASGPLLNYSGKWLTDMILHSGNPQLLAIYQMPVEKNGGGFMSWTELLNDGFTASYLESTLAAVWNSPAGVDSYRLYPASGLAYLVEAGAPDAAAALAWFKANVYDIVPNFNKNPKWAIIPRG